MRLVVNGSPMEVADDLTVAGLLRARGLEPRLVIVERNGEPVPRPEYEEIRLAPGDRLELVRAVAGG